MSVNETRSSIEVHVTGAAEVDDDAVKRPNVLYNTSKRLCKWLQQPVKAYTPGIAQVEQTVMDANAVRIIKGVQ